MVNTNADTSPQIYARIGGLAYLIIIAAGAFGEIAIRNTIIVTSDAVSTTNNIAASPLLWRMGIAGDLTMHVLDPVVTMVYYVLLRPVNKNLARLSVLFSLIQTAVLVANKMNLLMPLLLLENADYLKAFTLHQRQALAYLSVESHAYGFDIGLIFFGFECLIDGYLIFRSGYLPRILGVLIQIAGLSYLLNSFSRILSPSLANLIFPAVLAPAFIGELSMSLWLLVKGVNIVKWKKLVGNSYQNNY